MMPRTQKPRTQAPRMRVARNRDKERKRLADIIDHYGSLVDIPCDNCLLSGSLCMIMSDRSKSCSNCLRSNKTCCGRPLDQCEWVNWELDKFRADQSLYNSDMEIVYLTVEIRRKQEELSKLQNKLLEEFKRNSSFRTRSREVAERGNFFCDSDLQLINDSSPLGPATGGGLGETSPLIVGRFVGSR